MKHALLVLGFAVIAAAWPLTATADHGSESHCKLHGTDETARNEVPETVTVRPTLPDIEVRDQDGRPRRFYSDLVRGKTVAMNFVFTTCTTICPPMGANFARLQELLGDRVGSDVHLISVSVDPVVDTPERLKAWAARFGAGPGWTLVSGAKRDIDRLLKALKVYTADIRDHTPIVLVGSDRLDRWQRVYGLGAPTKLAEVLDGLADDGARLAEAAEVVR